MLFDPTLDPKSSVARVIGLVGNLTPPAVTRLANLARFLRIFGFASLLTAENIGKGVERDAYKLGHKPRRNGTLFNGNIWVIQRAGHIKRRDSACYSLAFWDWAKSQFDGIGPKVDGPLADSLYVFGL